MPQDDDASPDNDEVLTPEELDITEDERVAEIEEGRYVISSTGDKPQVPEDATEAVSRSVADSSDIPDDVIYEWLRDNVRNADARYGFDVTAKFGDAVRRQELFSNDVVTTFENLLVWYSQHVGEDTSVEEALGILLVESTVPVRYPASTIHALVRTYGLEPQDTIQELLDSIDESGVLFPPED